MTIIVIDDERTFGFHADYYKNSSDALSALSKILVNQKLRYADSIKELWLDHDLGNGDDIRIVVDFLYVVDIMIDNIFVHSQNPTTDWIVKVLDSKYSIRRVPLPI
jgi:hypothetical protein